ncbi:uncharacterized protein LOC117818384 isoform X2 [Notolabrus celidotus]|uniref:uncharacterized protein LOC117818384 isoform X2 n=1 Tax=Notolabrus celidotus TaxID=1203425 RepID=UPI00149085D9|nr:uncharacterized protein LOC117818384 isoform X2 [Notolabrus celidotus]
MSSVESWKEFINERLTAVVEDIFGVFIKTLVEYEEEIERQRRLLDTFKKPVIEVHRTEPQSKQQNLSDKQLCNQKRDSTLDQEDPEPPQIQEQQEELCRGQEGEQLDLEEETDTTMLTPASQPGQRSWRPEGSHSNAGKRACEGS